MADWMTIRVELVGRPGQALDPAPGRVVLAHADHAFSELADAVDVAFGRWDLTPLHEFEVAGQRLVAGGEPGDPDVADSDDVTLGEAALRAGTRFRYTFDLGEGWLHECLVEETSVDAVAAYGEEPETPVPVFGWGTVPDQYGRVSDDDEPDDDGDHDGDGDGDLWRVVDDAIGGLDQPLPDDELAAAATRLRSHAGLAVPPYDLLYAAAALDADALPDDPRALWLALAGGVVAPRSAAPLDPDAEAAWAALEPTDWAAAVIGLVRGDVGQSAEPEVLAHLVDACPELGDEPLAGEDRAAVVDGFRVVVRLWQALGALDADRRLTALGRWGLPEGLRVAWSS